MVCSENARRTAHVSRVDLPRHRFALDGAGASRQGARVLRRVIALVSLSVLVACGIKGPPRPPIENDEPPPVVARPDGGCCQEAR